MYFEYETVSPMQNGNCWRVKTKYSYLKTG
jgi:hypothetical protein